MSTASPFSNWVFSVPSRTPAPTYTAPTAYASANAYAGTPAPIYMPSYTPASSYTMPSTFAGANAYAGSALPSYLPSYTPPVSYGMPNAYASANAYAGIPSYTPTYTTPSYYPPVNYGLPSTYASANAYAGAGIPSYIPSYTPPINYGTSPYASASAYGGTSSSLNQLLPLLLSLISQMRQGNGSVQNTGTTAQNNINGTNLNNDTNLTNNGEISPTVNNVIINPDNVNINGVNTGVQANNDTKTTDAKTDDNGNPVPPTNNGKWGHIAKGAKPVMGADGNWHVSAAAGGGKKRKDAIISPTGDVLQAAHDPLAIDLNGDGIQTSDQKVNANIDGKILNVNDVVGDGVITLNGQVLGDQADLTALGITEKPKDAQEALSLIAKKAAQDGTIADPSNLSSQDLQVLHDKYGVAIRTEGLNSADKTFADAGVAGLNLSSAAATVTNNFDGKNNTLTQNGTTATLADGTKAQVGDIWFKA